MIKICGKSQIEDGKDQVGSVKKMTRGTPSMWKLKSKIRMSQALLQGGGPAHQTVSKKPVLISFWMKKVMSPNSESCRYQVTDLSSAERRLTLTPVAERTPRSPCSTLWNISFRLWRSADDSLSDSEKSSIV